MRRPPRKPLDRILSALEENGDGLACYNEQHIMEAREEYDAMVVEIARLKKKAGEGMTVKIIVYQDGKQVKETFEVKSLPEDLQSIYAPFDEKTVTWEKQTIVEV